MVHFNTNTVGGASRRSGRATTQPDRLSSTFHKPGKPGRRTRSIGSSSSRPKKKQAKLTHSTGIDDNKKNAFIQELRAIGIIDDKLKLDIIKKFLLNESYLMQHSRSLTNDFMKIISKENDGENKIYSKIRPHCEKNFNAIGNICFCCGETITQQHEKACDHVIPIITMLMTVTADSVPHNLHYIHKRCNTIKSNKNILEVFNNIGKPDGLFNCSEDKTEICKKMFVNILNSINFRAIPDITYRIGQIEPLNEAVDNLITKFELLFNDIKGAADILANMKKQPTEAHFGGRGKLTQKKKVLLHNPNIRRNNSRKPRRKI